MTGDHIHNTVTRCSGKDDTYCCADGPKCSCSAASNGNTTKIFDFLPAYTDLVGSSVATSTAAITSSLATPPGATPHTVTSSKSSSASSSGSSATTGTAASATTASPTATETPAQSSGSDDGLKVGLGVGIPLVILAAAIGGFFIWRYYGKAGRKSGPSELPGAGGGYQMYSSVGDGSYYPNNNHAPLVEAPGMAPQEMPAGQEQAFKNAQLQHAAELQASHPTTYR